ncbi:hypothetical protein ABZX69_13675 [Streptomyces sp. NPDC004074]
MDHALRLLFAVLRTIAVPTTVNVDSESCGSTRSRQFLTVY